MHTYVFAGYAPLHEASQEDTGGAAKWNMCCPQLSDGLYTAFDQRHHIV